MRGNAFLFSLLAMALSACATTKYRSTATSKPEFLKAVDKSAVSPDYDVAQADLERDLRWDGLYVSALPYTPVVSRSLLRKGVERDAFQEKWTEEKKKAALERVDTVLASAAKARLKETCFALSIEADTVSARNNKAWHFTLYANNKTYTARPKEELSGQRIERTYVYGGQYPGVSKSTTYDLDSTVCFDAEIDFAKHFELLVEPRFEAGIRPAIFRWLEPKT